MDVKFKDFWIRDWTVGDRDEAANVVRTVLKEYGLSWEVNCGGCSDQDVVEVEKYYHQTGGEFWVVERDRKIVGTGGYYPIKREHKAVEIRKMYLVPHVRGYGLGRFLLSQLEQAADRAGFLEVWVETATALKEAVRLYERNGYQPESDVDTERCDRAYRKRLS